MTDDLDQRDQILTSISEEIGIRTVTRANNDMAIYTDNGLTLFDTHARTVTFDATALFPALDRRRARHRRRRCRSRATPA